MAIEQARQKATDRRVASLMAEIHNQRWLKQPRKPYTADSFLVDPKKPEGTFEAKVRAMQAWASRLNREAKA